MVRLTVAHDKSILIGKRKWNDVVVLRSTLHLNKSTCHYKPGPQMLVMFPEKLVWMWILAGSKIGKSPWMLLSNAWLGVIAMKCSLRTRRSDRRLKRAKLSFQRSKFILAKEAGSPKGRNDNLLIRKLAFSICLAVEVRAETWPYRSQPAWIPSNPRPSSAPKLGSLENGTQRGLPRITRAKAWFRASQRGTQEANGANSCNVRIPIFAFTGAMGIWISLTKQRMLWLRLLDLCIFNLQTHHLDFAAQALEACDDQGLIADMSQHSLRPSARLWDCVFEQCFYFMFSSSWRRCF